MKKIIIFGINGKMVRLNLVLEQIRPGKVLCSMSENTAQNPSKYDNKIM